MLRRQPPHRNFTGFVGTRCRLGIAQYAAAVSAMNRQYHIARSNIVTIQAVVTNWAVIVDGGGPQGEQPGTATVTYTGSIEYPAGSFCQMTWNGSTSVAVLAGHTAISDSI